MKALTLTLSQGRPKVAAFIPRAYLTALTVIHVRSHEAVELRAAAIFVGLAVVTTLVLL